MYSRFCHKQDPEIAEISIEGHARGIYIIVIHPNFMDNNEDIPPSPSHLHYERAPETEQVAGDKRDVA